MTFCDDALVSEKNINMLNALCENLENGRIRFHEIVVPHPEIYDGLAEYGTGWAGEAYYALDAHLLLPDNVDRVLYLDAADTQVIGDNAPYYDCDFQGKSLMVTSIRYKLCQGMLEPLTAKDLGDIKEGLPGILRGIFNSGSYMMNLSKMRADQRTLEDYQYLSAVLKDCMGVENRTIYWTRFLERFQNKGQLRSMKELKVGQAGYFYMWYEYAVITESLLKKIL